MDSVIFLTLVIVVLSILFLILGLYFVILEVKKSAKSLKSNVILARFSFTNDEWEAIYQREFIEDENGKGFFNKYSGVIIYGSTTEENPQKEIVFQTETISLTDGRSFKTFKVNQLNSFGNGVHLNSIDLLHLSPLKKLRVKITADSINDNLNPINSDFEYLIPIPQSANEEIEKILKMY